MQNDVTRGAAAAGPLRALLLRLVVGGPAHAEPVASGGADGARVAGPAPLTVLILGGGLDGRAGGRDDELGARLAERLHVVTGRGVRVAVDRSSSSRTGAAPLATGGSELALVVVAPALGDVLGLSRRRRRAQVRRRIARVDAAAGRAPWLVLTGMPRPRVDSRADRLMRSQCDVVDADLRRIAEWRGDRTLFQPAPTFASVRAGLRLDARWTRSAAEGIVQRLIEGDSASRP